ncbi:MAG: response regulator [Candidatus Rokuibacteriota bacterium]
MRIRFWGTRGSLPKPGRTTLRYGGNTPCVEVRAPDGTLIVLDCGTGAHGLGQALLTGTPPVRGHLLLTHTHWDHIQGFPFFAPLFVPGNEWDIYAPQGLGQRLDQTLAGQMQYAYFPITLAQLGAAVRYHNLAEEAFELGGVRVTTRYLNHPGLALGYRLEAAGVSVVYATDHEPHSSHSLGARAGSEPVHLEDRRHVEFLAGADLVIHDAQYTLAEYPGKRTWGHTPAELAVDLARAAGARRLALFHHDPLRDDEALDKLVTTCRSRAAGSQLEVLAAAEGQSIELTAAAVAAPAASRSERTIGDAGLSPPAPTILIVDDDPDVVRLLTLTLEHEGFHLLSAPDGKTALEMARALRPDLVLLDWEMPGQNGLEVCRALRAERDRHLSRMPIIMLTGKTKAEDTEDGFAAGATDYVIKPFKAAHVRSRVHAWLLRSRRTEPEGRT